MRNPVRGALLMAVLVALPVLGGAGVASATPVDLVCPGAATGFATPGVTLIPGPVQFTGTVRGGTALSPATPCSSALTGVPYTGFVGTVVGSGTLGCAAVGVGNLVGGATATVSMTWNNGDTSTMLATLTSALGPVPIVTASITAGALQGSTVTGLGVPTAFTGNCLLAPVTSLSATGVGVFLQL